MTLRSFVSSFITLLSYLIFVRTCTTNQVLGASGLAPSCTSSSFCVQCLIDSHTHSCLRAQRDDMGRAARQDLLHTPEQPPALKCTLQVRWTRRHLLAESSKRHHFVTARFDIAAEVVYFCLYIRLGFLWFAASARTKTYSFCLPHKQKEGDMYLFGTT